MRSHCYWSQAALALAERQTVETETQARQILKRQGGYRDPLSGEWYPFPAPEAPVALLSKFPELAEMSRDANARLKLLHHRAARYEQLLTELQAAGSIEFYEPGTLLPLHPSELITDPIVDMDRIAEQIMEYAKARAKAPPSSTALPSAASKGSSKLTPAQHAEIRRRAGNGESQTKLAAEFGVSQPAISKICRGKKTASGPALASWIPR
ncbi:helix-turn-helix domain-containing protein [Burkholderia gladioli]|uniref:helix-turn-helix domain-containing protein n=1 Tax=Burkholderia gladioli TaxID=28095 RepID=UPI00163F2A09|nr:helix-turn-helix domain-containing protein [Burkholderia gladioli]